MSTKWKIHSSKKAAWISMSPGVIVEVAPEPIRKLIRKADEMGAVAVTIVTSKSVSRMQSRIMHELYGTMTYTTRAVRKADGGWVVTRKTTSDIM